MSKGNGKDAIAKCRCGRLYSPMEWAELEVAPNGTSRKCACGLLAVKVATVTLDEIEKAYNAALEGDDDDLG
jgi:hypothetical protein